MHHTIAFTEAKAKLSEILDRVSKGEEFTIARYNEPVAKLIPVRKTSLKEIGAAIEGLKRLAKGSHASADQIIAWKKKGQK